MNLGLASMASGAMQGFRQHQQDKQDSLDRAEARADREEQRAARRSNLRMAEEQHGARMEEFNAARGKREQQQAMQAKLAEVARRFYGEREVDDGEAVAEDGTKRPIKVRKTFAPGSDPRNDAAYAQAKLAALAQFRDVPVEELKSAYEFMQQAEQTEEGKLMLRVISGDREAGMEYAKRRGLDPSSVSFDFRPEKGVMDLVVGNERIDLWRPLALKTNADQYRRAASMIQAPIQARNLGRQGELVQSQIDENKAGRDLKRAQAGGVTDARRRGQVESLIQRQFGAIRDATNFTDPKAVWPKPGMWAQARLASSDGDLNANFAKVLRDYQEIESIADNYISVAKSSGQMAKLEQRLGVRGEGAVRQRLIEIHLDKNP